MHAKLVILIVKATQSNMFNNQFVNLSLMSPGVTAVLSIAITLLSYYLFNHRMALPKKIAIGVAASVPLLALVITILLKYFVSYNELPTNIFLITLPFAAALVLAAIAAKTSRTLLLLALVNIVLATTLSLSFANDYYHYYPTVGSIFNSKPKTDMNVQTVQLINANVSQPTKNIIEDNLYSKQPDLTYTGALTDVSIPTPSSKFQARTAYVYMPYVGLQNPSLDLPVLILSAGFPSFRGAADWTQGLNLQTSLDRFARNHHGITPLVVAVDTTGSPTNDTECVNSPAGQVETYLSKDVPNYIKGHFSVSTDPKKWAIGGISMGGMCSAMIALKHTDTYRSFLDFGGEAGPEVGTKEQTIVKLFYGSESKWAASQIDLLLATNQTYPHMSAYFLHAKDDNYQLNTEINKIYLESKQRGFDVVNESIAGKHTFDVFEKGFVDALPWVSNQLGATSCTNSCVYN